MIFISPADKIKKSSGKKRKSRYGFTLFLTLEQDCDSFPVEKTPYIIITGGTYERRCLKCEGKGNAHYFYRDFTQTMRLNLPSYFIITLKI